MGKSQETFSKKEKEKKRLKKRKEKLERREARKDNNNKGGSLDDMIAYVDEFGNIVDTPPDPTKRKKIKKEDIQVSVPTQEELDSADAMTGIVEFFNDEKGFGFIRDHDGKKYFVHITNAYREISEGDEVTFETTMTPKGINAVDVAPLQDEVEAVAKEGEEQAEAGAGESDGEGEQEVKSEADEVKDEA